METGEGERGEGERGEGERGEGGDFTDRLRDVFDLCDVQRKGYITVDHFIELAKSHFTTDDDDDANQQDWTEIVSVLKADGSDRIDFPDFCLRIKQILELQEKGPSKDSDENTSSGSTWSVGGATPYEENGSTHLSVDSDIRPLSSIFTHLRLSRTFSDECIPSITEDATNSSTDIGAEVRVMNDNQQERANSSLEEDYFEDNGQADATDDHLLAPFPKSLTPVSPRSFSSQLYRGGSSVNMSSRSSFSEEMIQTMDDLSLQEFNDKIGRLQNQITDLMENQRDNEQRQLRMKEENFLLSEKLLILEEQVRDTEHRTREQMTEQQKRHSELMERINKENSTEIEILTLNLQSIQGEYQHLRNEVPVLMSENEKLSRENFQLEKERDGLRKQFTKLTEEHESLREHMHSEHNKMSQEQKVHRQLIHELTAELEELRLSKREVLRVVPSSGADLPRSLRSELEDHILQLKQENTVLRGQRDDLQDQLLHQHFQEGRSLLNHKTSPSGTELEKLPKAELINVLHKEVEANKKLREYVELITLRILEKNPSILEVSSIDTTTTTT